MKAARTTVWAAVCALAAAVAAQAAFPWSEAAGGPPPALPTEMTWKGWKTWPGPGSWGHLEPCRMAGDVTSLIKGVGDDGYWLECDGETVAVRVPAPSWEKASLPAKNDRCFVLGAYQANGKAGEGHIEEVARFPLAGVAAREWERWLDEGGYEFAVENAYRRLAVEAGNGRRMPALDAIDWQKMRAEGKDLQKTEEAEILKFLKANTGTRGR